MDSEVTQTIGTREFVNRRSVCNVMKVKLKGNRTVSAVDARETSLLALPLSAWNIIPSVRERVE